VANKISFGGRIARLRWCPHRERGVGVFITRLGTPVARRGNYTKALEDLLSIVLRLLLSRVPVGGRPAATRDADASPQRT
jgi:hypothetical protein